MVSQEHIGFQGTVPGDAGVHPVYGVGVEVSSWQEGGDDDFAGWEGGGGFFNNSPE